MSIDVNCDVSKCGNVVNNVESEYQVPKGWSRIGLSHASTNVGSKYFHICPTCTDVLGMGNVKGIPDPGQELLDIIYSIAEEVNRE